MEITSRRFIDLISCQRISGYSIQKSEYEAGFNRNGVFFETVFLY